MNPLDRLAELFASFPGIGTRQSKRFVAFLLTKDPSFLRDLTHAIQVLKEQVVECAECHRFFAKTNANSTVCNVCVNPLTDKSTLLVVEKDSDEEAVRRSGVYKGSFFVLGGTLSFLEKNPSKAIRVRELVSTLEARTKSGVLKEVILALSATPDGDSTARYILKTIEPITAFHDTVVSSFGRGLSTGTELEYSDRDTLSEAFKNRR